MAVSAIFPSIFGIFLILNKNEHSCDLEINSDYVNQIMFFQIIKISFFDSNNGFAVEKVLSVNKHGFEFAPDRRYKRHLEKN